MMKPKTELFLRKQPKRSFRVLELLFYGVALALLAVPVLYFIGICVYGLVVLPVADVAANGWSGMSGSTRCTLGLDVCLLIVLSIFPLAYALARLEDSLKRWNERNEKRIRELEEVVSDANEA